MSLPISQCSHIRRICNKDQDFWLQAKYLEQRFHQRQYKQERMSGARSRFKGVTQSDCLHTHRRVKTQSDGPHTHGREKIEPMLNCMIQYSPLARAFQTFLRKHWYIIKSDPTLTCFTTPPRVVFERPPYLRT